MLPFLDGFSNQIRIFWLHVFGEYYTKLNVWSLRYICVLFWKEGGGGGEEEEDYALWGFESSIGEL